MPAKAPIPIEDGAGGTIDPARAATSETAYAFKGPLIAHTTPNGSFSWP